MFYCNNYYCYFLINYYFTYSHADKFIYIYLFQPHHVLVELVLEYMFGNRSMLYIHSRDTALALE